MKNTCVGVSFQWSFRHRNCSLNGRMNSFAGVFWTFFPRQPRIECTFITVKAAFCSTPDILTVHTSTYNLLNSCLLVIESDLVACVEQENGTKLSQISFFKLPWEKRLLSLDTHLRPLDFSLGNLNIVVASNMFRKCPDVTQKVSGHLIYVQ